VTRARSDDWKQDFANDAEKAMDHSIVTETVDEYVLNMRSNYGVDLSKGLPRMGLAKVMMAVALAARAQALGIDPDRLRLSDDEATEEMVAMLQRFHEAGKPAMIVVTDRKPRA
jgi:hypothetical protein